MMLGTCAQIRASFRSIELKKRTSARYNKRAENKNITTLMTSSSSSSSSSSFEIDYELHKENRERLNEALFLKSIKKTNNRKEIVLLQAGKQTQRYSSDNEPLFRQESYFHWLFGCKESDCFGSIDIGPNGTKKTVLFVPRIPKEFVVWMGEPMSNSEIAKKYLVDECKFVDELELYLLNEAKEGGIVLHLMSGRNTDSGSEISKAEVPESVLGMNDVEIRTDALFEEITYLRTIKTKREQEVLAFASRISSEAHVEAIKSVKPGTMEYQLEAEFLYQIYKRGGLRFASYPSICASGKNAAVLHYGHSGAPNDKECKAGELILLDMGGEFHCYCADITQTVPVNGKFTTDQKILYNGVLRAHKDVIKAIKPGVIWTDLHLLAERRILEMLKSLKIINDNSTIEEMLEYRVCAVFMPHGLGHLLGIDTHDVGGYGLKNSNYRERILKPGLKSCRTAKMLEENNVMTVEPGCYFVDALIDDVNMDEKVKKCINFETINQKFRGFGGVRIEDNVVVTSNGCISWTNVPRETEDIEKVMNGTLNWYKM